MLLGFSLPAGAGQDQPQASLVGRYVWSDERPRFGGLSGIELDDDGLGFAALGDRGYLIRGRLSRDAAGAVTAVAAGTTDWLLSSRGRRLAEGDSDSEGLARDGLGRLYVSFENNARVARHDGPGRPAVLLPRPPQFAQLPANGALEALAVAQDGTLYTLPEESRDPRGFPLWRWRGATWESAGFIPAVGRFAPVGADLGPDGRLYLLERDVNALLGFSSRVRRFDLGPEGPAGGVTLLQTAAFTHGDLEGLAVWQAADGSLRLTLIADSNFLWWMPTEIVDYRID